MDFSPTFLKFPNPSAAVTLGHRPLTIRHIPPRQPRGRLSTKTHHRHRHQHHSIDRQKCHFVCWVPTAAFEHFLAPTTSLRQGWLPRSLAPSMAKLLRSTMAFITAAFVTDNVVILDNRSSTIRPFSGHPATGLHWLPLQSPPPHRPLSMPTNGDQWLAAVAKFQW